MEWNGMSFRRKQTLNMHILAKHSSVEKSFLCDKCDKTFATASMLQQHKYAVHPDRPMLSCRFCPHKVKTKQALASHERKHTGEKPFACKLCSKTFKQASALNTHKLIHNGKLPHECKICHEKFRYAPTLKAHEKQHL